MGDVVSLSRIALSIPQLDRIWPGNSKRDATRKRAEINDLLLFRARKSRHFSPVCGGRVIW